MNILIIVGVIVAIIGLLTALFLRKVRLKKKIKALRWETKEEREDRRLRFWTYVFGIATILGVVCALSAWFLPSRAKLEKETEQRIQRIEREAKEANENIKRIEKELGIPIYVDGLPFADSSVFDPFAEGLKLMRVYKWDEAISEFQKAMKEAKGSQFVGLYNLVAICYHTSGRLPLALENYEKSLDLARQFNDKEGEAKVLGNIGLICKDRGDLDQALRYHQEALKIDKEIGFRRGEASDLGNLGNVYYLKGHLDQALKYHLESLEISRQIGHREYEASELGNIGLIYYGKGDLDQALKYCNEALRIFEEIGMPEQIGIVKGNIERISQQKKK